jgi:uncharacterized protein
MRETPGTEDHQALAGFDTEAPSGRWDVPWGILDLVAVLAISVIATVALMLGLGILAAVGLMPELLQPLLMPLPLIVLGVVTLVWVQARHGALRRLFGPSRNRLREWLLGIAWGVGAFVAVNLALVLLLQLLAGLVGVDLPQPQEGVRETAADPALLPWLVVSAVVVAPIAEELFFRGMLYQALRRRMGAWSAIAISATVFAAAHILQELDGQAGPVAFVLILPLGVLLGWLFERRGSLAAPIAVHAAFNLITVALLPAVAGGP